tara:strand:+ start:98 stop:337 length:240 start_codon:yes stop_codon:yes gene_type:complete
MKYLVNFKLKPQKGWSEIVDVESDLNDSNAKTEAKQKAAEMLKHRLLNDGILTLVDKSNIEACPMEWEKLKQEEQHEKH